MELSKQRLFNFITANMILFMAMQSFAKTTFDPKDPWRPENIVQKKGTQRLKEALVWSDGGKELPEGWKKIANRYVSIGYPSCGAPHGTQEQYDDPTHAEDLQVDTFNCPEFKGEEPKMAGIAFDHDQDYDEYMKEKRSPIPDNTLQIQDLKLNGNKAKMFVMALSDSIVPKDHLKIRWQIITLCKKNIIVITASSRQGSEAVELISNNHYEIPDFYRKIIETMHCK